MRGYNCPRPTRENQGPSIDSIVPNTGSFLGGIAIVITGTALTGMDTVTVGGVPAILVVVVNDQLMTAVAPSIGLGAKAVVTSGPLGISNALTFTGI